MNPPTTLTPAADTPMAALLLAAAVLVSRWDTKRLRVAVNTAAHGRPDGAADHEPALRALLAHLGIDGDGTAPGDLLDQWQKRTDPTNDELVQTLIAASKTAQGTDKAVA